MKKHILSTVISSLLFGATASYAENLQFQFRIPLKTQLSNWTGVEPVYHPWVKIGSYYDCADWSPLADTIDFGKDFTQSRDCKQNQERNIEIRELDSFSGTVKTVRNEQENRSVTEIESQSAIGTYQNWVSHDSTFTDWADKDAAHSFSTWTPEPIAQTVNFVQSRNYKQPQVRHEQHREIDTVTGDVKNIGEPILRTQDDIRSENRSVTINWTAWEDTKRDGYGAWGPVVYTETTDFTQTRVYGQHQIRYRVYAADSTELSRFEENRVVSPLYENRVVNVTVNAWSDTTRGSYSSWAPVATTQTANFTQSRTYTQNQERTWSYKTGGTDLSSRIETRGVANQSESQTVAVSWSAWTNTGVHYTCGTWTPATNTVAYGESFTQTRSCKQDQTRSRIYKVGSTTINTVAETQTIDKIESQSAVGAGSWTSTTSTFTTWENSGAGYNHGTWTPAAGTQTANYTQTRSYSQDQTRTEQKREVDTIGGTIRNIGYPIAQTQTITPSENQSVAVTASAWANTTTSGHTTWSPAASAQTASFTQSRTYTQAQSRTWTHKVGSTTIHTRNETQSLTGQSESRTVTVSWSGWTNSGSAYGHTTWSPAPAAQTADFTQTRGFSQNQTRTRTYSSGESFTENQMLTSGIESRTVIVSSSSWSNSSSVSYGSWSPVASNQTTGFTQVRTVSQPQSRIWTYSDGSTVINSRVENQTVTENPESRSITVSWSSWLNNGSPYACGGWSPSPSTVNYGQSFTQTRSCAQDEMRYRNYSEGSSFGEYNTYSVNQYQSATGTYQNWVSSASTCGSWYNSGSYSYGSWSPAVSGQLSDFSQSASYSVPQQRSCNYMQTDTVTGQTRTTGSFSENRTNTGTTYRTVSVRFEPWRVVLVSNSCTEWTPSSSTITNGQTFTQSRSCWTTWYRGVAYTSDGFYQPVDQYKDTLEPEYRSATGSK